MKSPRTNAPASLASHIVTGSAVGAAEPLGRARSGKTLRIAALHSSPLRKRAVLRANHGKVWVDGLASDHATATAQVVARKLVLQPNPSSSAAADALRGLGALIWMRRGDGLVTRELHRDVWDVVRGQVMRPWDQAKQGADELKRSLQASLARPAPVIDYAVQCDDGDVSRASVAIRLHLSGLGVFMQRMWALHVRRLSQCGVPTHAMPCIAEAVAFQIKGDVRALIVQGVHLASHRYPQPRGLDALHDRVLGTAQRLVERSIECGQVAQRIELDFAAMQMVAETASVR